MDCELNCEELERAMQRFETLSTSQLQQICWSSGTDQNIIDLVDDMFQVRELERERCLLFETCQMQSENNINRKPAIDRAREGLTRLVDESRHLENSIRCFADENKTILSKIMLKQATVEDQDATLMAEATKADEDSENIAKSFLRKEFNSYDTFLDEYLKSRKIAHLSRMRAEKFYDRSIKPFIKQ